jgi:hypothetical protein
MKRLLAIIGILALIAGLALTGRADIYENRAATTTAPGIVELATDAETVTGTATTVVTTPANITARMAAPGAIGGTTPSTAAFTAVDVDRASSAVTGSSDIKAIDVEAIHSAVVTGTSQDLYGARYWVQKAGADTSPDSYTTYGQSISATNTGATNTGTKTTYGISSSAIGDTAGTSTTYGVYTSGSGADTNYGLYSASGTNVFVLNAAEQVYINATSTPQTQTEGALEIDVTTATDGVFAVNIDLSNTKTTGIGTTAMYVGARSSAVVTSGNQALYGAEIYSTKSGADTNADATQVRGVNVQAQNTGSTNAGTRITMGGYFSGTGDTAGTSTAYGVYATATGADTNYAGYFSGDVAVTGTIEQGGLKYYSLAAAKNDEDSITLPTITANYSGHGFVRVSSAGVIQDSCAFESGSDGNVSLIRGTANVVVGAACANAKICISTAGAQNPIVIQSRNGAAQVQIEFWYH